MTIHHLQLWVPDLTRADRSWGWLLGELGYSPERRWELGRIWRKDGTAIVLEESPDMVPGMLHSRLRPGLNHVAFGVDGPDHVARLAAEAPGYGWTELGDQTGHKLPVETTVAYLEDGDGFEVELIASAMNS